MKLVRVNKIAASYDIPLSTLYRWNCKNRFPGLFYSIGRILFVDEDRLLELARKVEERERVKE